MKRLASIGVLLAAALGLAACSSGSSSNGIPNESATQIVNSVGNALGSAKSVAISGNATQSGTAVTFTISTFSNGSFTGNISDNGTSFKLIKIGSTDYLNATAAYYEKQGVPASAAGEVGGKWIYAPDSQFGFGNSFVLSELEKSVKSPTGKVTKGASGTIGGQPAQAVVSSQGTLWVATTGPAFPLELTKNGSSSEKITFSDWNEGTPPVAPSGAIALSSLGG
ncbi:MAG: hypothetical protein WAM97_12665 [Acidimicrobiales bacterium]